MTDRPSSSSRPRGGKLGGGGGRGRPGAQARALAASILADVEDGAWANELLRERLTEIELPDGRDRRLVTELVYGVLRWQRRLDHALAPWVRRGGLDRLEPMARLLLRVGAYQLLMLDRVPARAAVSATQDAARVVGFGRISGLLNGVLRRVSEAEERLPAGDDDGAIGVRASLPDWIVGELRATCGTGYELEKEALALRERPRTTVRPTAARGGPDAAEAALVEAGFEVSRREDGLLELTGGLGDPFATAGFTAGLFVPQDPASLAVVDALEIEPGMRVLDLCAGRGIKSTALADRGATVVAVDIDGSKLDAATQLAERLGLSERITFRRGDGTALDLGDMPAFDRVLLDAPCTGLGTLRRHPEIAWRREPSDVGSLLPLQSKLLAVAGEQLAPGGRLVYAVCTFTRAEAEPPTPSGLKWAEVPRCSMPSAGDDAFAIKVYCR